MKLLTLSYTSELLEFCLLARTINIIIDINRMCVCVCVRACVIAQLVRESCYGLFISGTLKGRKFKSQ